MSLVLLDWSSLIKMLASSHAFKWQRAGELMMGENSMGEGGGGSATAGHSLSAPFQQSPPFQALQLIPGV
jgi:hypothetical protein